MQFPPLTITEDDKVFLVFNFYTQEDLNKKRHLIYKSQFLTNFFNEPIPYYQLNQQKISSVQFYQIINNEVITL